MYPVGSIPIFKIPLCFSGGLVKKKSGNHSISRQYKSCLGKYNKYINKLQRFFIEPCSEIVYTLPWHPNDSVELQQESFDIDTALSKFVYNTKHTYRKK